MHHCRVVATFVALTLSVCAQGTGAADPGRDKEAVADPRIQEKVREIEETVVTPTRAAENIFDAARSIAVLRDDELATRRTPSTFPDAFRDVPGVMVQKTGPGLGSPFIRGFTGFRTLLLVDGVRLNHSAFREGPNQYWATVDPLSIERLEVAKGPGSVAWGSDAAGGTVNAITETVELGEVGAGWDFGGRAYYRYDSAEDSHVGRGQFTGAYDGQFGFSLGGTYRSFGDTDAGGDERRQHGLGYDAYAVDAKIRALVEDDVEVEFLFQRVRLNNVGRHHATATGTRFHGTTIGSDQRRDFDQTRDLVLVTARHSDGNFYEHAEIKLFYQRHDEIEDRIRSSGRRDKSGFEIDTVGLIAQAETATSIGDLIYGIDLYLDLVDSFRNRLDPNGTFTQAAQGPIGDDSHYLNVGAFIEDAIALQDWGRLTLGLRFNHVDVESDTVIDPVTGSAGSLEKDYQALAGSAALLIHAHENLNVWLAANSGYRIPNLSDLTRFDSARSNEFEIPSPDIDTEYFVGFEIGARYEGECLRAELAYFYTILIDNITRSPTGATNALGEVLIDKNNVGDGYVHGVEFAAAWDVHDDVTLSGQFTWHRGEQDQFPTSAPVIAREPLSRVQPITARFAVEWRPAFVDGLRIEASTEIVDRADRLDSRDLTDTQRIPPGGTPGYTLYNLRFNYQVTEELEVFLHLDNLSDKNYRIHGSGSNEAGFSAIAGFDLRF